MRPLISRVKWRRPRTRPATASARAGGAGLRACSVVAADPPPRKRRRSVVALRRPQGVARHPDRTVGRRRGRPCPDRRSIAVSVPVYPAAGLLHPAKRVEQVGAVPAQRGGPSAGRGDRHALRPERLAVGLHQDTAGRFLQKSAERFPAGRVLRLPNCPSPTKFLRFAGAALTRQQEMNIGVKRAEIEKEQAQYIHPGRRTGHQEKARTTWPSAARNWKRVDHAKPAGAGKSCAPRRPIWIPKCAAHPRQPGCARLPVLPPSADAAVRARSLKNARQLQFSRQRRASPACPTSAAMFRLQIKVENLSLVKVWTGPNALPQLLLDFYDGQKTFSADDFPGQKAALDGLNIKSITVRYQFTGHLQVLRQADELFDLKRRELAMVEESRLVQVWCRRRGRQDLSGEKRRHQIQTGRPGGQGEATGRRSALRPARARRRRRLLDPNYRMSRRRCARKTLIPPPKPKKVTVTKLARRARRPAARATTGCRSAFLPGGRPSAWWPSSRPMATILKRCS